MVVANEKHQRVGAGGGRPRTSVPSPASVVKKSGLMNSEPGIWNTLIHKEAAEAS